MTYPQPVPPVEPTPTPKKRGCLFWGCLTVGLVGLVLGGCVGIIALQLYQFAKTYTSTEPKPVPEFTPAPGQYERVKGKIEEFKAAPEDKPTELILSADDINAWIARDPELRFLRGKAFVRIEGDRVFVDVSIPMDELFHEVFGLKEMPGLAGRYFNGSIGARVEASAGKAVMRIDTVTADGKELPEEVKARIAKKNLLEGIEKEQGFRVDSVEVRDAKLILRRSGGQPRKVESK